MAAIHNAILAALPRKQYLKLRAKLSPVTLVFGKVIYERNAPMRDVYFPDACLVSLLTVVDGHMALEVGMVGSEGMVGSALALGAQRSPVRALVQGGGPALRMSRPAFLRALRQSPALQRGVHGHIRVLMGQLTQTAACNRFHVVQARLARWLLMTRDRVGSAELPMTQKFLSSMLGVRRVGVTEAASALKKRKLIEYNRGSIRILDHAGLEAASCSCYEPPARSPWRSRRAGAPRE